MRYLTAFCYILLAAFFLYAGVDKAFHYGGFIKALDNYVIVPEGTARYLALPVVLVEIWVGLALLVRPWRRGAVLSAAALLVVFTAALALNHRYAPGTVCGCWFTLSLGKATTDHILMNLFLLGLALTLWPDAAARRGAGTKTTSTDQVSKIVLDPDRGVPSNPISLN